MTEKATLDQLNMLLKGAVQSPAAKQRKALVSGAHSPK